VHQCAATFPAAPDPASQPIREGSSAPHALWFWTLPPYSGGLRCCDMYRGSRPCLPASEGSGAATCHTASDPVSLLGKALVLPRAPWLWIPPPCLREIQCCHMPHGFRPCIPAWEGSSAVMCPTILRGSQTLRIKKGLAGLPMRLGSRVSKACLHAS
jgi:hypothetical protein